MIRSLTLALLASAALSGCTALGALNRASEPQDVYELRAGDGVPVARGAPRSSDLVIEVPSASGALETDRIMVRPSASQIQYLPDARWSEPGPQMIQTALVEALERSGGFRFVGRRPLAASGDYALVSNLTDFHAVVIPESDGAEIKVTLTARLVRESDASVSASRTFTASVIAADLRTPTIVAAFDSAGKQVFAEIAGWVLAARGIAAGGA